MRMVNMHEAKTHLSRLVDQAAKGEPFVIARAGKPLVQVTKLEPVPSLPPRRLDFLKGDFTVPDDIKTPFKAEIERMFCGDETE